jgi:2-haloacid dehalogenase
MAERAVVFDMLGTVFDLSSLSGRLEALDAPGGTLQACFGRSLHHAAALTLVDEFAPFNEILETALRSTLAELELDPEGAADVVAGLEELDPYPDAREAFELLTTSGIRIAALTNGGASNTTKLLERVGLAEYVERVVAAEAVRVYKPHPALYRHALDTLGLDPAGAILVAAHAWDVVGALAVGMDAIWVERLERLWPLPVREAASTADLADAARVVIGTAA